MVEGQARTSFGDVLFKNETELDFKTKYVSVYIQTDRAIYYSPDNKIANTGPATGKQMFAKNRKPFTDIFLANS